MLKPETDDIYKYLQVTDIIDFDHDLVKTAAERLRSNIPSFMPPNISDKSSLAYVKAAFEYVRDAFPHSFDLLESGMPVSQVSCKASDVLQNSHGICYAKSHLLSALLRSAGIPAGFCYQKLRFSDKNSKIVLHAVNAVYLAGLKKWIRLDARGNRKDIDAQFSVGEERLAFPVRTWLGEEDGLIVYAEPSRNVIKALTDAKTLSDLIINLPAEV